MVRWYRAQFSHTPAEFRKAAGVIPGVTFKGSGALVPENAAWVVQEAAKVCGVNARFSPELLARVPAAAQRVACICARCAGAPAHA